MNWLDTVRTLTDMGVARDTIADVQYAVDVLEGLDFEPGCEGPHHQSGEWGHVPSEHASWIIQTPCGEQIMLCNAWVQNALTYPVMYCTDDHDHATHEFRFIPLTPISTP